MGIYSPPTRLFNNIKLKKTRGFLHLSQEELDKMFTPDPGDYGYGSHIQDMTINDKTYHTISAPCEYLDYKGCITRFVMESLTLIIEENFTTPSAEEHSLVEIARPWKR